LIVIFKKFIIKSSISKEIYFRLDSKNSKVLFHASFDSSGAYRSPEGFAKA
jgi:hypothetical protein